MDSRQLDLAPVAKELGIPLNSIHRTLELLDDGNTVPFITRYRKEQTGNLDEEQIREIQHRAKSLRQLSDRAETILRLIDSQGKLTPDLRAKIEAADSLKRLEDLYLPYRPKRRSRAAAARERGLQPFAEAVWRGDAPQDLESTARQYVSPAKSLEDCDAVLAGVRDILAERIQEHVGVRSAMRKLVQRTGQLTSSSSARDDQAAQPFRDYFDYAEHVSRIPPHRVLALNRGESAKVLRVKLAWDGDQAVADTEAQLKLQTHPHRAYLRTCIADSLDRFLRPALEREVRRDLTERAERHAVGVFAENLRHLLLQPPLRGERVLAIDPGLRTGCKIAVLDEFGRPVARDVIFITGSAERRVTARNRLAELMQEHDCLTIAIGNGTACRETEEIVAELIADVVPSARYVIVNEAGASIYSASPAARDEFPDLDATVRGTISIGRRLQDPLSELVKIDGQHLGVGMYQHDLNEKSLRESLAEVVESCVNYVGVDLNRASAALLRNVSGFNQLIARRVVAYRDEHGPFLNRGQLLGVPGVGDGTFTQAAGFLKISNGDDPLDGTWIHPESYPVARQLLASVGLSAEHVRSGLTDEQRQTLADLDVAALAERLSTGVPTLVDIIEALLRPGRDPRAEFPGPVFKCGILRMEDLEIGMELTGTVLNVVDFGAFVDVGLKQSGLVHISRMAEGYVRSTHDVVSVGDVLTVWVEDVDRDRNRLSLTMIKPGAAQSAPSLRVDRETEPSDHAPRSAVRAQPLRGFDELKQAWNDRKPNGQ